MFVICTLLNASDEINGIAFEDHPEGKVSVEKVPDEIAAIFESIPGYKLAKTKDSKKAEKSEAGDTDPAKK